MALRSLCAACLAPGHLAVVASFFIFFLSLGSISSFVILYVYIQGDFQASAIETGWVGSAAWAVMNFLAPLPSALYVRFGCQRVILVGVLLASGGLLATSFASQLWMMYITYGLMFGAGSNFVLTATINLVTSYYPGDSNIRATSLASTGQPIGLLVISASLERACFYLGWRNGLRIVSGFTLAVGLFCTAMSRPPENCASSTRNYQDVDCKSRASCHDREAGSSEGAVCNGAPATTAEAHSTVGSGITRVKRGILGKRNYQHVPSADENGFVLAGSPESLHENTRQYLSKSSTELDQIESVSHYSVGTEKHMHLITSLESRKAESSPAVHQIGTKAESEESSWSFCEDASLTGTLGQRSASEEPKPKPESASLESVAQGKDKAVRPPPPPRAFLARYVRLLRLPGHWFFFTGVIGSALAGLFNVIHFVSFADTIDIAEPTASGLLIAMSGMEIGARIPVFVCGNRVPVQRTIVYAVVCVMGAFATYGLVLLPNFTVVVAYVLVLGFVRGILYAIAYGATVDTFGADCALESYTSLLISYGIAGALGSTIGISKDLTGKFTISLHIIAALFLLSAIMFICAHVWWKRNALTGRRDLIECDLNANEKCGVEKVVGHQENGAIADCRGAAMTAV